MIAKKIHHPDAHVTNRKAPAAIWSFPASMALPLATCQYVPARQPNATTRVKKMMTKAMLVRMEHMRYTKHIMPMDRKKKAKLA